MREPPRLATWILKHWTPIDECLAGDLVERYHRGGRSSLWYWRQLFSAIVHAAIGDVGAHPARMTLSIGIGLIVVWWGPNYVLFSLLNFPEWLFTTGLARSPYLTGSGLPTALREFPMLAAWKALVYAGSGWIVARVACRPSVTVTYLPFVVVADVVMLVQNFGHYPIAQLIVDLLILYPLATLVGGLTASRGSEPIRGVES